MIIIEHVKYAFGKEIVRVSSEPDAAPTYTTRAKDGTLGAFGSQMSLEDLIYLLAIFAARDAGKAPEDCRTFAIATAPTSRLAQQQSSN